MQIRFLFCKRMTSKPKQHHIHVSGGQTQRQTLRQTDNLCAPGVLVLIRVKYFSKIVSTDLHEITAMCLLTKCLNVCECPLTFYIVMVLGEKWKILITMICHRRTAVEFTIPLKSSIVHSSVSLCVTK